MPLNSLRIENFSVLRAWEYKTPSYRENAQNTPLKCLYVDISWGELFWLLLHGFQAKLKNGSQNASKLAQN